MKFLRVLAFGALLVQPSAAAVVTFEGLADLEPVTSQFAALGVQFVNTTVLAAGQSLNEFEHPPSSGANVAFDDGGPVSLYFTSPMANFEAWITFITQVTLLAFDHSDLLIGATSTQESSNLGTRQRIAIWVPGIHRVDLIGSLSGFSFTFDDAAFSGADVPEPSYAFVSLLLAGLLALRQRSGR